MRPDSLVTMIPITQFLFFVVSILYNVFISFLLSFSKMIHIIGFVIAIGFYLSLIIMITREGGIIKQQFVTIICSTSTTAISLLIIAIFLIAFDKILDQFGYPIIVIFLLFYYYVYQFYFSYYNF